jgi:hypothetical protein
MIMGPEPMIRILLISVRLGIRYDALHPTPLPSGEREEVRGIWNSIPSFSRILQKGLAYHEVQEKLRDGIVRKRSEIAYASFLPGFGH